jgi:uncharacterized membrane protein YecN with MAPEG domain
MPVPITALTAAISALMLLLTAFATVRERMRLRAPYGTMDDPKLIAASRSHGNLAEHAPLAVLLIGVLELSRAHHWALTGVAVLFLAARASHIIGLHMPITGKAPPLPRQFGVIGTWVAYAVLIVWTIVTVVRLNG